MTTLDRDEVEAIAAATRSLTFSALTMDEHRDLMAAVLRQVSNRALQPVVKKLEWSGDTAVSMP